MAADPLRSRQGFILAAVLWILAGIAVIAALLSLWSREQVARAQLSQARVEARLSMMGTRDTLLYMLATTPRTRAGLPPQPLSQELVASRHLEEFGGIDPAPVGGEIAVDGVAHQGLGKINFALQDESGLVSLFWPDARALDGLLIDWGIDPERIPRLRDALLDYIDTDSLRRPYGDESEGYRRARNPPPPNRRLLLAAELRRVAGWSDLPEALLAELEEYGTTANAGAINLNAVPAGLLPRLLDGCPALCEAYLAQRREQPFLSGHQVQQRLGVALPGDAFTDYRSGPSETVRLTLWGEQGGAWRIHVRLTPVADRSAPWLISSAYPYSRPEGNELPRPTGSPLLTDPEASER